MKIKTLERKKFPISSLVHILTILVLIILIILVDILENQLLQNTVLQLILTTTLVGFIVATLLNFSNDIIELNEELIEYKDFFQNATDMLCIASEDGYFIKVNPSFTSILGYSEDELLDKPFTDFIHPDDLESTLQEMEKLSEGISTTNFENRYYRSDGKYIWLSWKAFPKDNRIIAVARDVTDRKEYQRLYLTRTIVDSIRDPLLLLDYDFNVLFFNSAYLEYFDEIENIVGESIFAINYHFWNDGRIRGALNQISNLDDRSLRLEDITLIKNNREIVLDLSITKAEFTKFDDELILLRFKDITNEIQNQREIKNLQNQLLQSQKLEAVGRLAGGISHDFNNILSVILGYSKLLQSKYNQLTQEQINRYLDEVISSGKLAVELIENMLSFSRANPINQEEIFIDERIKKSLQMTSRIIPEHISIQTKLTASNAKILIDKGQYEQIFLNLMINSIDAMPSGGDIFIETSTSTDPIVVPEQQENDLSNGYVKIVFSDNGKGMERETLNKIFEPYFTTKDESKGTGLGLSTVYGIVKQNNGVIRCYSEPNMGTVFRIYFPLFHGSQQVMRDDPMNNPVAKIEGLNLLLVEDNLSVLTLIEDQLSTRGVSVITSQNPVDALEILKNRSSNIDLILSDIIMPTMNGLEFKNKLDRTGTDIPIIFMSGYTKNILEENAISSLSQLGYFIEKPFDFGELERLINQALGEHDSN